MDDYQKALFDTFSSYRPEPEYPTYPPYHRGPYIEDKFISDFLNDNGTHSRFFIPISWTTIYCDNKDNGLQFLLDSLDKNLKYFTVCQHDDAPQHGLPPDTLVFSASEHVRSKNPNMIPIPAICSPIPNVVHRNKRTFAGFVGSYTHPVRHLLHSLYNTVNGYKFSVQQWSNQVRPSRVYEFIEVTSECKFTLCPSGYGNTSFRLYECMQLGSVPVYISDDFHLPWSDEINWSEFSVLVDIKDIENLDDILKGVSEEKYQDMLDVVKKIYDDYFTLGSLYSNIIRRIT